MGSLVVRGTAGGMPVFGKSLRHDSISNILTPSQQIYLSPHIQPHPIGYKHTRPSIANSHRSRKEPNQPESHRYPPEMSG